MMCYKELQRVLSHYLQQFLYYCDRYNIQTNFIFTTLKDQKKTFIAYYVERHIRMSNGVDDSGNYVYVYLEQRDRTQGTELSTKT